MLLSRRIKENRPLVILGILVLLSLASLASGTQGSFLTKGVRAVVSVVAHPFLKTLKLAEHGAQYVAGFVTDYRAGWEKAAHLEQALNDVAPQLAERPELVAENERLRRLLNFERSQPRLDLMPAEVIGRQVGTLIVDRGAVHGVQPFVCVMTKEGIVGVVREVQPSLSYVSTLHSTECRIGALIRRNRATGIVRGSGSDFSHICTLQYIDLKDEVREGDEVVTSGGQIYPRGFPIGKVTAVHDEGTLLKMAYVEPTTDPYRVDEVFLVLRAEPDAQETPESASAREATPPEQKPTPEATAAGGSAPAQSAIPEVYAMPDTRTAQERYAP